MDAEYQRHNVYEIGIAGDPKDIADNKYKLTAVTKPGHEFILEKPAWNRAFYVPKKACATINGDKRFLCDANNVALTAHGKVKPGEKTRECKLVFPDSVSLTDRFFVASGASTDRLEVESHMHTYHLKTGQATINSDGEVLVEGDKAVEHKNISPVMYYRFVDLNSGIPLQDADAKKANANKLAQSLKEGMVDESDDEE